MTFIFRLDCRSTGKIGNEVAGNGRKLFIQVITFIRTGNVIFLMFVIRCDRDSVDAEGTAVDGINFIVVGSDQCADLPDLAAFRAGCLKGGDIGLPVITVIVLRIAGGLTPGEGHAAGLLVSVNIEEEVDHALFGIELREVALIIIVDLVPVAVGDVLDVLGEGTVNRLFLIAVQPEVQIAEGNDADQDKRNEKPQKAGIKLRSALQLFAVCFLRF